MTLSIIEWTIFIVAIIVLIVCSLIYFNAPNLQTYINIHNIQSNTFLTLETLLENADTGDIILMAGDTRGERVCRWFSGSMYSHVGFILKEDGIPYVWEADMGQQTKDGPRLIKLSDKIELYKGFPYVLWRRLTSNRPSTEDVMQIVHTYKHYKMDEQMLSWFSRMFKKEDALFCSELVALTMQKLNMMNDHYEPFNYTPKDFEGYIKGLNSDVNYSDGQFIKI